MRCPDCNKFVSLEMSDPEVESDLEITPADFGGCTCGRVGEHDIHDPDCPALVASSDPQFHISGSVRIVRTCAECSAELKEATLDIDLDVAWGELIAGDEPPRAEVLGALKSQAHEADLEEYSIDPTEEGGGRYAKSYFGAEVTFHINIGDVTVASAIFSDKVAASSMDELV